MTNILVYVGSRKKGQGVQYNVSDVKIHKAYDNEMKTNDIAVLTLSQDIKMGKDVAAACLPTEPVKNYVGLSLTASGWGLMRGNTQTGDLQVLKNLEIVAECPTEEVG